MATLEQIAETFNVSAMSVSNALNNKKGISQKKAEAIRKYAESIGFRPAHMAKAMLNNKTDIVGVCLFSNLEDPWSGTMMHHLQDSFRKHQLHMNIAIADSGVDSQKWALNFFNELRVDAVVIGPLLLRDYNAIHAYLKGLPYVLAFGSTEILPIDHVKLNEFEGSRLAIDHLVKMGHTKIGHVGIRLGQINPAFDRYSRYSGYCDAMKRHGLELHPEWVINAEDEFENTVENRLTDFLKTSQEKPTAWFFQGDSIAARCYRIFAKFGMRIPEDVSIVGFDNHQISKIIIPSLTTIDYSMIEYSEKIVEFVLKAIKQRQDCNSTTPPDFKFNFCELEPRLLERNSVKRLISE